ncbi:winged helix-turn-helix domain-containing protein [Ideonella azotifigens]|uniref:Winged helix-turn-helix domain-containing protein n=1 Tax=Ideonella azotifigens TaxID=513160 RepID=A0ABP3UV65_9BURK
MRFGPSRRFELQPEEGRLLVDGQPATLGRRALDLLIALAERPEHLLTKGELLDRVWPGLVVEEANLQMQISNLRKVLGNELIATVPGRGYRFTAQVGEAASVPPMPLSAPTATPPQPAPVASVATAAPRPAARRLIGRDPDLARLEALLQVEGCVTLVGTAGVGKTSLARLVAARWAGRSVWVDLAALDQDQQITGALARALDLHLTGHDEDAPAQLVAALDGQQLLLVLDNAEHLVQACAELASLLGPLAGVRLLVTSQVPLAVAGERVLRLEPLALVGPEAGTGAVAPDGALALLVERVIAADHRFAVTPAAQPLLHAVCAQLDGLPLALEMAAARVPLLGLQGVHDALAQRFALLTRGHRDAATRHRTLHNALEWSYALLGSTEQRLFRSLGVFADGFTLDLAVGLMTDDPQARWDVIDGLATLADRSLVVVSSEDPPRYRLLETLRAFALEQLAQQPAQADAPAGEAATVRRRHAGAVLALFSRHILSDPVTTAMCLPEMENARDALAWARGHDLAVAAQLSARIVGVTTFTIWRHESGNWLLALEPRMLESAGLALPAEVQALWWTERARVGVIRRDANARVPARRAVALWRSLGQPRQLLRATLGWVRSIAVADPELAEACAELKTLAEAIPDLTPRERLGILGALGRAAVIRGDRLAVLAVREKELALAQQLGDQDAAEAAESSIVGVLGHLSRHAEAAERGQALLARVDADGSGRNGNLPWVIGPLLEALVALGRLDEARALLPRSLAAARRFATPTLGPPLCALASAERRHGPAAQLLGHARQGYESRGMTFEPQEAALLAGVLAAASAALGVAQAERLVQQGRLLTEEAAEALATGDAP